MAQLFSLGIMARSIEKLALRLMKAAKAEERRCPDPLKRRVIGDLAAPICKSQQEFELVLRFILDREFILSTDRGDGHVADVLVAGDAWIASHKEKWNPQARVAMLTLIWIIGLYCVGRIVAWLATR